MKKITLIQLAEFLVILVGNLMQNEYMLNRFRQTKFRN